MRSQESAALLIATTNPAKQARLRELVAGLPARVQTPDELGLRLDVAEDGRTHQENALLKAVGWSRHARCFALASDGGLLLPALGGRWDSLRTQRFAGPDADDRGRAAALLALMSGLEVEARRASWVEAVALAVNGTPLAVWELRGGDGVIATSLGSAAMEPGFWVASLWAFPSLGKTYCEASPSELARVGEPWSRLKPLVRDGLLRYVMPAL